MSRGSLARIGERPRTWVRTKAKDNAEAQRHRERFGVGGFVTELQTGARKRGCKLLIPQARFLRYPPPRVFWKKSLDLFDSKGVDFFGDDKEAARIWKQRGWRELQVRIGRGNTRNGTTDLDVSQ